MFEKGIPYCYFPTQVVIVDDDPTFSTNLALAIGQKFRSQEFNFPQEALDYLKEQAERVKKLFSRYISKLDYSPSTIGVNINIESFFKDICRQESRFDYPAVVVVDYSMPSMDGLSFCKALQGLPYQKIVLTGEVDNDFAVEAFNQGHIDRFLKKGGENYITKLESYLQACNIDYFTRLSESMSDILNSHNQGLLQDKRFIHLFNQVLSEHNIIEFYLIDEMGSYCLINKKGEQIELIIKTEEEMQHFAELACDDESVNAASVSEAITQRKKLPYLFTWEDKLAPAADWQLYNASKLQADSGYYYYAIIK